MQYETWHALHFALYLAIAVGVAHQLLEGTTFPASPAARAYRQLTEFLVTTAQPAELA